MELVILAAGMGSRFGGLKQMEPLGPNGEFIIDYSIYDAVRNGFNKIVFIIKEENHQICHLHHWWPHHRRHPFGRSQRPCWQGRMEP